MVSKMPELLSSENEVFRTYAFWVAVLVLKMLAVSFLTVIQRIKNMAFVSPEDVVLNIQKVEFGIEDIERVRRAHRNDLENILPFFAVGLLYILINPEATVAIWLIRAVAISRIVHTIVYAVIVVPQPARALSFAISYGITGYMAIKTMIFFL